MGLKSNMDRFIATYRLQIRSIQSCLKSNMDRFIAQTFLSACKSYVGLKSNMDRFIEFWRNNYGF